jgi:MFS transporter, DHA2 family, integral membrane protein
VIETTAALYDDERVHRLRWWTLAVLCLSLVIVFVGNSSLNVAIPSLSRDLEATTSQLQWIVAAYALVFAGLLFTAGAIGDRYGRKTALQFGLLLFLLSALAASASTETWQLIASRATMGAGAAFIMPSTLSILINVFPPQERTKAIAIWAAAAGVAGIVGPVASGLLLEHFWYGSVFLINVPIVAVALLAGRFLVPESKDPEGAKLDPVGAGLSIVGIVAFVYGLIEAPDKGWTSPQTLVTFLIAAAVLTIFVLWERHVDVPMIDMHFFRNPAFSVGTTGMIVVFLAMYGVMFLVTQYFQLVLGYSPLGAAVRLFPMAPIMIIVSPMTPRLSARFGAHRTVAFGMFSVAAGMLLFRGLGLDTAYPYVLACLLPLVIGFALTMSPMTASIMSAVPPRRAGVGSAMNDATRELGTALGVAVLGSLAASRYSATLSDLTAALGLSPAAQHTANSSLAGAIETAGTLPASAGQALTTDAQRAFVQGLHLAVSVGAALAILAAGLVLRFLPHMASHGTAMRGPVETMEEAAEVGVAGTPPIFADQYSETSLPAGEVS